MLRKLVIVFGVVEALFPEQVVTLLGRLGYRTEGPVEPRAWLVAAARVEGVTLAVAGVLSLLARCCGSKEGRQDSPVEELDIGVSDEE